MRREYDTFVSRGDEIPLNQVIDLNIRELTPDDRKKKYRYRYVRANMTENSAEADVLWLLSKTTGYRYSRPLSINILEDLGEFKSFRREDLEGTTKADKTEYEAPAAM
ncbi:MAG: hypothetical protein HY644_00400 [Acidobacteria bacterium]|nr:hypothetical protein [Acidobacteriota bacterium]